MKLRALIRSCTNEHVARAALISIGGEFAVRVAAEAARQELSCGRYVAQSLRDFERDSDLCVWGAAERVMHSSEQPILAGLYFILDHCLAHARSADHCDDQAPIAQRANDGPLGVEFAASPAKAATKTAAHSAPKRQPEFAPQ